MAKKYKIGLVIEGDGKGGVRAIKATDDALDKLSKQTKKTTKGSKSLKEGFAGVATKAGAVGAAIAGVTAIAGTFAAALRVDVIKELKATSDAFGVSVESLSSWAYAAKSVGLETDKIGDIFKDTADKIGDFVATGGGEAKDIFDNLGLSVKDLQGLKPDEQLLKIAEGLEEVGTNGEKIFYLESLADEASRLLPLLENGAKGLKELQREAEILGVTLDDVDAQMVKEAADAFQTLGGAAEGFANQLTIQLSAAFEGMSDGIVDVIEDFGGMEEIVESFVEGTVEGIAFVINALHALEIILTTIKLGWELIGGSVATFLEGMEEGIADVINYTISPFLTAIEEIGILVAAIAEGFGEFLGDTGDGLVDLGEKIFETTQELGDFKVGGDDVKSVLDDMKGAADKTAQELEVLKKSSPGDEFIQNFKDAQEETRKQAEEAVALAAAAEDVKGKIDKVTDATGDQADASENAADKLDEVTEATKRQAEEADPYAKAWEEAVKRIDAAFADGWLDILEGNATDVFDSILDSFKRMLAEMLHQAITKPIILQFQQAVGSAFGIQGMNQGGGGYFGGSGSGGLSSYAGIASNAYDYYNGGSGSGGWFGGGNGTNWFSSNSIGTGFESFGNYFGGTDGGVFSGASNYSNTAYASAGILGGAFGSTAGNNGGIGGATGAQIGMAAFGPIGAIVGAVLGAAIGSLIGAKWEEYEKGISLEFNSEDGFLAQSYSREKKDRGLWRGNDYRTNYEDNDELTERLGGIFSNLMTSVEGAADQLGIDTVTIRTGPNAPGSEYDTYADLFGPGFEEWAARMAQNNGNFEFDMSLEDYLKEFSFAREFDLTGLTQEEAFKKINDFVISKTDEVVEVVFGDALAGFQQKGETLVNTLGRVMAQLDLVDSGFDALNLSLEQLAANAGVSELQFSDDVVQAAGGADRLNALMRGYQSAFFTEEELLTRTLENMASTVKSELDALGLSYGDDFRASFEAASAQGLAAEDVVSWLEAGNMLAQFEAVGQQLADLMGTGLSDVLSPIIDNAEIIEPEEGESNSQAAAIADPIVDKVADLNDTVNERIGESNETLITIEKGLGEVKGAIDDSMRTFTDEVREIKTQTDAAIVETQKLVRATAIAIEQGSNSNADLIRDISRLITEPGYRTQPVLPPDPII